MQDRSVKLIQCHGPHLHTQILQRPDYFVTLSNYTINSTIASDGHFRILNMKIKIFGNLKQFPNILILSLYVFFLIVETEIGCYENKIANA